MSGPVLTSVQGYQDRTVLGAVYPTESVTRVVNIDTRFRENPGGTNASDCTVRLPRTFKNITSIRLSSAEIPNNWYEFRNNLGNTSFSVNDLPCVIPDGNYTADTLAVVIQSTVYNVTSNAGVIHDPSFAPTTLNVLFEEVTGRCRIDLSAASGSFKIDWSAVVPPLCFACNGCGNDAGAYCSCGGCIRSPVQNRPFDTTLGSFLGFHSNVYTGEKSYTSEDITNLVGSTYVLLQLENYNAIDQVGSNSSAIPAFAKIVVNVNKNNVIYSDGKNTITNKYQFSEPENISVLRLKLVDCYGRVLPLYGNMSFTLEMQEAVSSKLYTAYKDNLVGRR